MTDDRRLLWSGFLFGCGIAGAIIDLFVFHLGLQWHHFYDRSTTRVALVADGFFHAVTWFITVGSFQLLDGVVSHKLLRIHQIRYEVDLLPYDATWIGSAVLLAVVGWLLLRRSAPAGGRAGVGPGPTAPGRHRS